MKSSFFFNVCILLLTSQTPTAFVPIAPTVVDNSLVVSNFLLTWFDDFNTSTGINSTQWNVQLGCIQGGCTTLENVFIQNNNLYLKQTNTTACTNGTKPEYSQGRINSQKYFGYGYYEARIQFPNISSWHESFWLVGLQTFPPPFFNQEIDIVEVNTYNMFYYPQHFHCWTNGTSKNKLANSVTYWKLNVNVPTLTAYSSLQNWHIFGLHWNRTHMETYLDGGRLLTTVYPSFINPNPMNILFSQYIWNDVRFPMINATSYMIVDYVSYYKNGVEENPNLCTAANLSSSICFS